MDWRRAKSVLILAFLLLNALLGYQLWNEWRAQLGATADWTSLPASTRQMMQEKNIRIEGPIPKATPLMRREVAYELQPSPPDTAAARKQIDPPVEGRIVFVERELREALGGVIPDIGKFEFDDPGSREGVFVFNRMHDGWPIFDVHLELYYSEQKIMAYTQDMIELLPADSTEEERVLPAAKALASLVENYLPDGASVKQIRLGYHGPIFDSKTQISAPSWRVLLESGEVYYVHAISGEVATEASETSQPSAAAATDDRG